MDRPQVYEAVDSERLFPNRYTRDEPLLRIANVSKSYGTKEVLSHVNLDVRDLHCTGRVVGQVIAFLGPTGIGKTQLLQIIAGLEPPTSGSVFLDDDAHPVRPGAVGVVFQKYPVFRHRRVLSNLRLVGTVSGMPAKQAEECGRRYLQLLGLAGDADKYPAELSGGMQQRLAIARQLVRFDGPRAHPSRLLLMDEPFAALDTGNTAKACALIRSIADLDDKNTIAVVTHDIRAALSIADMVVVMGRCPESGGGTIVRVIDLPTTGFPCWDPDIQRTPEFSSLADELTRMFKVV